MKRVQELKNNSYEDLLKDSKKKSKLAKKLSSTLKNNTVNTSITISKDPIVDKRKFQLKNFLNKNKKAIVISSAAIATMLGANSLYKRKKT